MTGTDLDISSRNVDVTSEILGADVAQVLAPPVPDGAGEPVQRPRHVEPLLLGHVVQLLLDPQIEEVHQGTVFPAAQAKQQRGLSLYLSENVVRGHAKGDFDGAAVAGAVEPFAGIDACYRLRQETFLGR